MSFMFQGMYAEAGVLHKKKTRREKRRKEKKKLIVGPLNRHNIFFRHKFKSTQAIY